MSEQDPRINSQPPDEGSKASAPEAVAKAPQQLDEKKLAYYEASQWVLMRRRFSKHRVALWMLNVVVILYVLCLFCDFFSPYDPNTIHKDWVNLPPQFLKLGPVGDGAIPQPYVHPYTRVRNKVTLASRYYVDETKKLPLKFFVKGYTWKLFGLLETDRHLFGVEPEALIGPGADIPDARVTIAQDPEVESPRFTVVTFHGAEISRAPLARGDVITLPVEPDGTPSNQTTTEYRIAAVDYEANTALLDNGPWNAITEPVQATVRREHTAFLLGSGPLGRDQLSRLFHGGRISLLVGLTGVILSFTLGITLGGISGYFGGKIDMVIQRLAEILMTVPKIPLWIAMAAAIPKEWTSLQVYFMMTLILACMGWTGLCRVVRGKLLSLREEDYARAALLAGATERRVIYVHLIPNFISHIIASLTLAVPGMILAETSLSFLGLGLRPPIVSWGVLLQQTQRVEVVQNQPWLLLPAGMVVISVLAFNFVGEGLRDAADPYST